MLTDETAQTVTITATLGYVTASTPQPIVEISPDTTGIISIGAQSAWSGSMVTGGTLTKTVSISPISNGSTRVTVTAKISGGTFRYAAFNANVDIEQQ